MKFQNCILINFEPTHGRTEGRADARTSRKQYVPSTFPSWGHKNTIDKARKRDTASYNKTIGAFFFG